MVSKEMQDVYNKLIQVDFNSAFLYLAIANYFERQNLTGMAKWLRAQYNEELTHALLLNDNLLMRNGVVELKGIPKQKIDFGTAQEAWKSILDHEESVTKTYKNALDISRSLNDPQAEILFQQFLQEQIDEVAQATTILGRLNYVSGNDSALLLIDDELSKRAG